MSIQIVYDSKFGNTKQIAQIISNKMAEKASVQLISADEASSSIAGVALLIVGSPAQAWLPTKAAQAFLEEIPQGALNGLEVAAFDTRLKRPMLLTGSAARSLAKTPKKKGGTLILPPESFFVSGTEGPLVEGEAGRAAIRAGEILKKYDMNAQGANSGL
jgi:flavodoxin